MRFLLTICLALSVSAFTPSTEKALRRGARSIMTPLSPRVSTPLAISTEETSVLQETELPRKLYFPKEKEVPKVLGGLKIGLRELVVVTGASSGLGLNCAATLAKTGKYFVVMACRDVEKGKAGKFDLGILRWRLSTVSHFGDLQSRRKWACPTIRTS